jgi:uncharacterized protein (DUF2062 family)
MAKLKEKILQLLSLNRRPQDIALGVAIGVFIAIMPLYGLHTLLVLLAAFLVRRANIIAILIGTNISLPPTLPLITWAGYSLGRIILRNSYPAIDLTSLSKLSYKHFLIFYYPLVVGSAVLGLSLASIFYFITLHLTRKWQARKSRP